MGAWEKHTHNAGLAGKAQWVSEWTEWEGWAGPAPSLFGIVQWLLATAGGLHSPHLPSARGAVCDPWVLAMPQAQLSASVSGVESFLELQETAAGDF